MDTPTQRPPTVDPAAAARWQQRAQDSSAWLHDEVARRMESRLEWIMRSPRRWLDWEPVRGGLAAQALLARRYPQARMAIEAAHPAEQALASARARGPWWRFGRWRDAAPAPAEGVDLLWANMTLHQSADPQGLIRRWHDAMAVDGFLMFSCLGPDTLGEIRALYQRMGWPAPAHEFTDMHDWGDMLVAAGFAEPVMDMERIQLTFETPERLLQELRSLGTNLHPGRFAGLRGRGWKAQLLKALDSSQSTGEDGRLSLTFEIIYGHAFKPAPKLTIAPETRVSVEQMRAALKQTRPES